MSTRFNTVHPGRAPLPGPPRFTTVLFDMSKTTGKTPGSSRSIRHHPGTSRCTTVQPPVLPDSPRSMDRGEPGSTGSPVGLGHKSSLFPSSISTFSSLLFLVLLSLSQCPLSKPKCLPCDTLPKVMSHTSFQVVSSYRRTTNEVVFDGEPMDNLEGTQLVADTGLAG